MKAQILKAYINLHRAVNFMDKETTRIYNNHALTMPQFAVLEALYHKGDLCVGDVQEKILSSSGTITVIVKNLVKRNLVKTYKDESDKRRVMLSITIEGKKLMDIVYPQNEKKIMEIMNALSKEELLILGNLYKKIGEEYAKEKNC